MKKCVLFILLLCVLLVPINSVNYANANSVKYAQITSNKAYLYRNALDNPDISNIWCELPQTYFVEILNDYNDNFYKVNYNSVIGFVLKTDVKEVLSSVKSPYPSGINVSINSSNGCYMRSLPISKTNTNNIIDTLNKGTSNISFIGYAYGDECIDLKGTLWYLVKYNNNIGYIYADFIANKITLYPNIEEVTYLSNNITSTMLNPLSDTSTLIIVITIMVPCIIILILLFMPKPKYKRAKVANKNKIKEIDLTEISDIYNDIDI